jgi:hypothetical protein
MLTEMASFERFGRRRRSTHRTYRVSRLLWLVVGLAATFAMTLALQVANGVLLRQLVLAIPKDLHRNADANREFVLSHPTIAVLAALADLVQIVLTVVLATVIMRFFWRLVVADARRLLEDPGYRPVVFCAPSRTTRRPSSPSVCSIGSSGAAAGSRRLRPPHSSRSERQSPSASPASNCHSSARSVPTIPMTPGRRPCSPGCSAPS